ncbi:MAG: S46 family peptidase [Acidobacteriia bacterium]|nr:S46 family peptidase [Terriglobia bacterium]
MKKSYFFYFCAALLLTSLSFAEEGMWLYTAIPKDKLKAKYGFEPTQEWLDQMRLSSVRFTGGSGSFVSPNGLVMTNHHIGAGCINAVSSTTKDYMKTGFYAPTQAEEVQCPKMSVRVLEGIENITEKVNAALKDVPPAEAPANQRNTLNRLQTECGTATKLSCEAVSMFSGAMYFMYKYKPYNDVRLVFAPEYPMAFFGGDDDNFEYPRYDLDVTFLRVYENNQPVRPEHYFSWSKNGAKNNELVFVSGHPGTTARLNTVAQLEFLRDVQYPIQLAGYARTIESLIKQSAVSEEERRRLERQLFSQQNSAKATHGYYSGLLDKELMAAKAADEKQLRSAFMKNPKLTAEYGDPWKDVAEYYGLLREGNLYAERQYFPYSTGQGGPGGRGGQGAPGGRGGGASPAAGSGPAGAFRGTLPDMALMLIRAVAEKEKPEADRMATFRDPAAVEQRLFATDEKISRDDDIAALGATLAEINKFLPGNPVVAKALGGRTPQQAAREIITNTRVGDLDFRKQLYAGGSAALESSTDPLVALVRAANAEGRRVSDEYAKKITPLEAARTAAETKIAKIRFAVQGLTSPPDANSTLRLSYGTVKGYVEDGLGTVPKGTKLAPFTTIKQAYDYADKHGNNEPYKLPDSWMNAKGKVNGKTPLNLVSTNDIIGGNSGSPVLNKKAEIVGLVFDGNIQMLPGRFQFAEKMNRAVSVDSRGIMEAVRNIYNATALADELSGSTTKTAKGAGK